MGGEVGLPTVTVVIPVRDDPRLADCLDAVRAQDYPHELVDVVVVDNGGHGGVDGPVRAASESGLTVRVVREPRGGSYAARNAALRVAGGEVVAFTDADCRPEKSWVSVAVRRLQDGADIVAGKVQVYARDPRRPSPVEAYELVHAFPQKTYVSRRGACVTANLVTTRAVIDAVGCFLDDLKSGADIEWSQRANGLRFRTVYAADALVYHPARRTYAELRVKLNRVMAGRAERDRLEGRSGPLDWAAARAWVPPIGAFRRAMTSRELVTRRARAAFVWGEFYHRYSSALIATKLAARSRRRSLRLTRMAR